MVKNNNISFKKKINRLLNKFFDTKKWVSIDFKKEIPSFIVEAAIVDKIKVDRELRINTLLLITFIIFSSIIYRVVSLSNNIDNIFKKKEVVKIIKTKQKVLNRFDILDRNGVVLATDLPTEELYADPKMILFPDRTAEEIVKIFPKLDLEKIRTNLKSKRRFVYIKRKISPIEKEMILKIGDPGLNFITKNSRFYPQGKQFCKILGSTDIDNDGVSGLEKYFNDDLKNSEINHLEDKALELSVDTNINYVIRNHLVSGMERFDAVNAGAILMKKDTGEIISMVSLPDFHPKNAKQYLNNQLYNNNMTLGVYEPGSIFKVFNTAMALEEGLFEKGRTYDMSKAFKVGGFTIKDKKSKGIINIPQVLAYSSNVGSARIALELGREKQEAMLRSYHFFDKNPIEVPEVGLALTPKRWKKTETAVLSYGYGMSVSPISLLAAFNATINNGCYKQATLLKISEDNEGDTNCDRILSVANSEIIRKNLRLVVLGGTAQLAKSDKIMIGGKTGTSYKQGNGGYSEIKRTFFTSAFPIENPKYSLLVFFDDVKAEESRYWCSDASCNAVPISKDIIEDIFELLE